MVNTYIAHGDRCGQTGFVPYEDAHNPTQYPQFAEEWLTPESAMTAAKDIGYTNVMVFLIAVKGD
ncbi:MAG: hypothetical protein HXX17_07990 [Geobacteraceae bacterium]|nr:hypothetical protein [Geobacteraceae bacterium]